VNSLSDLFSDRLLLIAALLKRWVRSAGFSPCGGRRAKARTMNPAVALAAQRSIIQSDKDAPLSPI
jgi:hypothetical protein